MSKPTDKWGKSTMEYIQEWEEWINKVKAVFAEIRPKWLKNEQS